MGRFDFIRRRRGATADLGRAGEEEAARWLWRRGYRILARNYNNAIGEIDLVAERGGVCVFVEVKTRTTEPAEGDAARDPLDAVDARKKRNMRAAARVYLDAFLPARFPHRFDLIAVERDARGRLRVKKHQAGALDPIPVEFVPMHAGVRLDAALTRLLGDAEEE